MQPEGNPRADRHANGDANMHADSGADSDGHRYTFPADQYAGARAYRIAYANKFTNGGADLYTDSVAHLHTVTVASSWPADQCAVAASGSGSA